MSTICREERKHRNRREDKEHEGEINIRKQNSYKRSEKCVLNKKYSKMYLLFTLSIFIHSTRAGLVCLFHWIIWNDPKTQGIVGRGEQRDVWEVEANTVAENKHLNFSTLSVSQTSVYYSNMEEKPNKCTFTLIYKQSWLPESASGADLTRLCCNIRCDDIIINI